METIEVRYDPLSFFYNHKYIVYTNSAGTEYYARGGPQFEASIDELVGGTSGGNLVTQYGLYVDGTDDWDNEGDDAVELISSGSNLSASWNAIKLAMDAIEIEAYDYSPFFASSNTAVDEALIRAGLPEPQADNIWFENWAPGSGLRLSSPENQFSEYAGTVTDLAERLVRPDPRIAVVENSVIYTGANSATSLFVNLHQNDVRLPFGVLLTSGDGTPPTSNTSSSFGVNNSQPGDADLTAIVGTVFAGNTQTYDATVLQFQINVSGTSVSTILLDVIFGSDEYPEYANSFVDIGAVFVNGTNVANFNNDPQKPLSVLSANLDAFRDNAGGTIPIEYDGISPKLTISAPVHAGVNTVKIAIADTGDARYDSGLFVANLRGTEFSGSSVMIRVDAGGDIDLANILNSAGDDVNEHFVGGNGNDQIFAGGGNDLVDGGNNNDQVHGGDGNDQLLGGDGADTVYGDAGNDTLMAGAGNGPDTYVGGGGTDVITYVSTTLGVIVNLSAATNQGHGSEVDVDQITGVENVTGGAGNDTLTGNTGKNVLSGGAGNDILDGRAGDDRLSGGAGTDTASYAGATAGVTVNLGLTGARNTFGAGTDTLISIENLTGGTGNDTLTGNSGNNVLNGGTGNDTMAGGAGNDSYVRNAAGDVVTEAANKGTDTVQSAVAYTLPVNLENLTLTGTANINGTGNTGHNVLTGNSGKNVLTGNSGNDKLNGGLGNDTMSGGAGADVFLFNSTRSAANIDRVTGYSVADDTIQLENAIFTSLTGTGVLAAGRFIKGAGLTHAVGGDDYLVYNTSNGYLYYDQGGTGGAASQHFATLTGVVGTLTAADFVVV